MIKMAAEQMAEVWVVIKSLKSCDNFTIVRGLNNCSSFVRLITCTSHMANSSDVFLYSVKPEVKVTPSQIFSVERTTVSFHCVVYGVPLPVISWRFNGGQLPNNSQEVNNSLIMKDIINTADNEGTYTCVGTSRAGIAESTANLTVWGELSLIHNT